MPRRAVRGPPRQKTTILFKAGNLPSNAGELFRRVFWKSDFLASEAQNFWHEVKRSEPMGLPIQAWKDWISKRSMSVGQFYNMIHGLVGAGFIESISPSRIRVTETGFRSLALTSLTMYRRSKGRPRCRLRTFVLIPLDRVSSLTTRASSPCFLTAGPNGSFSSMMFARLSQLRDLRNFRRSRFLAENARTL